ncbi:MAG TPA: S8 family peptidase [Acidimicrobiales bacterium]|nr:S8 family peptidase [Acidimicrobiales bacterium]
MNGISWARTRPLAALIAALLVAGLVAAAPKVEAAPAAAAPAPAAEGHATGSVIVQAVPGGAARAAEAVEDAGGSVGEALALINGFEAELPAGATVASDAIVSITPNRQVEFENVSYDETTTASNFARSSGATSAWAAGNLGQGVGVAIIDTGIAGMNDFAGRVVHGPDLSGEGTTIDSFGHGTVMAGIVGGSGADSANGSTGSSGYTGVAPKAHLVSVKAAGRNGVTDVSTMLQAMHWVSAYKDQYNIRVLNLSWGTTSKQDPAIDPLNYAVQRLWRQGIVVVTAAGNSGPQSGTITKPGDDPVVITVGAYDDKQNTDPADDNVPGWSSRGPTAQGVAKPDVVAPGRTLIAARAFGSTVEKDNPKALISPSYIKGSGSSQASALTSGLVALMLAQRPELTPDQVKHLLRSTANPIANTGSTAQGSGRVRLEAALQASADAAPVQAVTAGGLGSLEASRGGRNVETDCQPDGVIDVIKGEITYRCESWDPASWTGTSWTGTSWTGTSWTGTSWTGTSWTGTSWTGTSWTGTSWTGGTWTGTSWTGTSWTGTSWTGTSWTGTSWTGTSWTGTSWTTAEYTTGTWGDEDEFLTAFWGGRPRTRLPGEVSEIEISRHLPQRS